MTTNIPGLLELLARHEVEFVLIGGVAASAHGSARATYDVDVVYRRSRENVAKLVGALKAQRPYLRGAPPGLPFTLDEATVRMGLNFTLKTDLGDLDVLGEVVGGGTYEDLLPRSVEVEIGGVRCLCATLDALIAMKRAAGRPKDFEAIAELERIREERGSEASG
jgi:predicted nucleotidyltransferase